MCDEGYFSVANLHFQYKSNATFRLRTVKCTNCSKKCSSKGNSSQVDEDDATQMETDDELGEWVDLSGQKMYNLYNDKNNVIENDEIEMNSLLILDETEKVILDGIKQSFPYFRKYK